ncbi:MAG TPA: hypothetical protein VHD85_22920 [Terracidiphilus sp.]|nr:hypothetical protein [Terracidiphilus sp.]
MRITNINGTSDNDCSCGSWLIHWKRYSGVPLPPTCACTTCYDRPTVGAHVQKDTLLDNAWYIVPLCDAHNRSTAALDIGNTPLVSANTADTCAKVEAVKA